MRMRARRVVPMLMALIVATACGSAPSSVATTSAAPTSTPRATPSPTPAAVLDDRFGLLIQKVDAWQVRRESDPVPLYTLQTGGASGLKVSPDGRRVAYWTGNDLRVLDVAPDARPRTLLTVGSPESGSYSHMAWSSDSTGLVVGVVGPFDPVPDAPPAYTALRVVDVAGGTPREVIRIPGNIVPVTWDRKARLIAAYMQMCCGARYYYVVEEGGTFRLANVGGDISLYVVEASQDGQMVLGRGDPDSRIRVWPRDSYEGGVELRAAGDEHILAAAWRPGTAEIGVLFADRLELWDTSGARRAVALPAAPPSPDRFASLVFRADGKAVLIGRMLDTSGTNGYVLAVDLANGRNIVVQWNGPAPQPGTSVRLGP